jgi:copper/silver efflux system protein
MLERIIEWSVRNRFIVVILTGFVVVAGFLAMRSMPLEAIPDLSDVQVIVRTDYAGQAPQIIEDQVTYPIASEMLKVPGAETVRGYSFFGTSFVYVIFDDGTDLYWARSRVQEYLSSIRGQLPAGARPSWVRTPRGWAGSTSTCWRTRAGPGRWRTSDRSRTGTSATS